MVSKSRSMKRRFEYYQNESVLLVTSYASDNDLRSEFVQSSGKALDLKLKVLSAQKNQPLFPS